MPREGLDSGRFVPSQGIKTRRRKVMLFLSLAGPALTAGSWQVASSDNAGFRSGAKRQFPPNRHLL